MHDGARWTRLIRNVQQGQDDVGEWEEVCRWGDCFLDGDLMAG